MIGGSGTVLEVRTPGNGVEPQLVPRTQGWEAEIVDIDAQCCPVICDQTAVARG
jgi:hypothetical protein